MQATLDKPVRAVGGAAAAAAGQDEDQRLPKQYLRFRLGDGLFAVAIDAVREILQVGAMTALPLMPAMVRGVMNLRGAVVPVIDLAARLGLSVASIGPRSCIVIVQITDPQDDKAQTVGVLVDAVYEVFEMNSLEACPAFGTPIDPEFIAGMARYDGGVLAVLEFDRALAQDDLAQLVSGHKDH
jgi:purine-binding chemotaxis protein CheW